MAFSLTALEAELDKVVSGASTFADLVDTYAHDIAPFASAIPTVGPEVATVVALVDEADKALHALKSFLDGLTA